MKSVAGMKTVAAILALVFSIPVLGTAHRAFGDLVSGKGEWQSRSGDAIRGTWTVTLERSGAELSGTLALTGSLLFSGSKVSGTLENDQLMLGSLTEDEHQATFSGKVTNGRISGEWSSPSIGDSGEWSGVLLLPTED
jgi:hypothetical protein